MSPFVLAAVVALALVAKFPALVAAVAVEKPPNLLSLAVAQIVDTVAVAAAAAAAVDTVAVVAEARPMLYGLMMHVNDASQ